MSESRIIAIIDDDKIFHVLTRKILERATPSDRIIEFYDGQEALDYIVKNSEAPDVLPDLIFLDIQMPFVDGWQFLDQYSHLKLPKKIIVYIVSSSISSLDHDKSQHYKINGFIVKPFTRDKIVEVLDDFSRKF
jgi:CheY-like chemotaxis protein